MNEHRLEVADVFRQYGEEFLKRWGHTVSPQQRKALRDIGACRTATLGGHIEQCDRCPHRVIAYNSCRNRHCPKCQSSARDRWLTERAKELLPVPYCHAVFTVPDQLAPLALQNQRLFYGLLFRAVSQTLLEIAADPRHLGAQIGFLAMLHTSRMATQCSACRHEKTIEPWVHLAAHAGWIKRTDCAQCVRNGGPARV